MPLLKLRDAETDPGVPFVYPEKDGGKVVRFRIRRIPRAIEIEIEARHDARIQSYHFDKGGGGRLKIDYDKQEAMAIDRAAYALIDSEGFEGQADDDPSAARYGMLLGNGVVVGKPFTFDGHLNDQTKRHLFSEFPALREWIIQCADSLSLKVRETEQALAKN